MKTNTLEQSIFSPWHQLQLPSSYTLKFHSKKQCMFQDTANGNKVIILRHEEENLDFAKVMLMNTIFQSLNHTWFYLKAIFKEVSTQISSAPIKGYHQGVEMTGTISINTINNEGGFILLSISEKQQHSGEASNPLAVELAKQLVDLSTNRLRQFAA